MAWIDDEIARQKARIQEQDKRDRLKTHEIEVVKAKGPNYYARLVEATRAAVDKYNRAFRNIPAAHITIGCDAGGQLSISAQGRTAKIWLSDSSLSIHKRVEESGITDGAVGATQNLELKVDGNDNVYAGWYDDVERTVGWVLYDVMSNLNR